MNVQLILFAGNSFTCDGTAVKSNLIQVHKKMWDELFNNTPFVRPEDGILLEVPRGFKPVTEVSMQ